MAQYALLPPGILQIAKVVLELGQPDTTDARYKAKAYPVFNVFITRFQGNAILAQR